MNLIKYAGRRLYSAQLKRMVTIKDVIKGVRGGVILKVTCAETRRDITGEILAQAALVAGIDPEMAIRIIKIKA